MVDVYDDRFINIYSVNFKKGWNVMYQSGGDLEIKNGKDIIIFKQTTEIYNGEVIWKTGNFLAGG